MADCRVSIAIACHAATPWFEETLKSVLDGRLPDGAEILICDDVSPAGGDGDTARAYAERYPDRIRVFRNAEHLHIAGSYNRLLRESRGEYFIPFDSDDIFVPFDIEGSMRFLDSDPSFAATYGKKRYFSAARGDHGEVSGSEFSLFTLLFHPRISHNGMVIRKSDLVEAGGYPDDVPGTTAPDIYMWMRLAIRRKLSFFDEYRAFYRVHDNQTSREMKGSEYAAMEEELARRFPELYEQLKEWRPFQVTDDNRHAVQMLLGRLYRTAEDANRKLTILDTAVRLDPNDYGTYQTRARLLLDHNMPQDALRDAYQVQLCKPASARICEVGTGLAMEASEMIWKSKGIFEKQNQKYREHIFQLTPEQDTLYARALAHAHASNVVGARESASPLP